MALFDLSLDALREYRPSLEEPADLAEFWEGTLSRSREASAPILEIDRADNGLALVDTWDVTFAGHDGTPVRAWYNRPAGGGDELPVVVEYLGYGGGRGEPHERLAWASAGYGHLLMDTRGQGSGWGAGGHTADPAGSGPAAPGVMTRGIESPHTSYLTRLLTDAARAVDAARELPGADGRVAVTGGSQGGGLALGTAGLVPDVDALLTDVPFLTHMRRAVDITDADPYQEIVRYLAVHRDLEEQTFATLAYVDALHLGRRATAPALFSVALRDMICPPSTVFAAYNLYGSATGTDPEREINVYPYNGHEGGGATQQRRQLGWLRARW
ncbi:acetylxylan esterase [Brachybacterium ginsengisoli]|uniref:Acetylxylan esterase n=1 Tax=Brachybacterium ginsengisoli TaxID=1331682 RepID=A0A291H142_9MICO|nr:acetylxylan esterase [Brachybacterium ginsengisoli]ATG56181.1 acetylxylan esterase [Brachybacterium ginsengisoli]